ncbi:MAG: hypothetical protein QJR07_12655 [Acetobacteraceae bacterium]|nr:hypothetical protein [Acetobacteraceae bacterium]
MSSDEAPPIPDEAEPPEDAGHGLRRGILFGLLFAAPFWIGLAYTIWWLL